MEGCSESHKVNVLEAIGILIFLGSVLDILIFTI